MQISTKNVPMNNPFLFVHLYVWKDEDATHIPCNLL